MKLIAILALLLATLAACTGPQPSAADRATWERSDPARRVYGGGGS
jgi:hypothetical protein